MALLLSCRGIAKIYGEINVLKEIDLDISTSERIGLVGQNGAGKTTLADIIFGTLDFNSGNIIQHKKDLRRGYLRQVNNNPEYLSHDMLQDTYAQGRSDYFKITSRLGINQLQNRDDNLTSLSGGEKTKLNLAGIWASRPDLLILDEPTNNLDIRGMEWLVEELRKYQGAALIISHDRYFLDQTVQRIVEIEDGVLNDYRGNYSFYRDEKKRRYESQLHRYEVQEKTKQEIANNIDQLTNWSTKAHRESRAKAAGLGGRIGGKEYFRAKAKKKDRSIKSKIKRLQKIEVEGIAKPEDESQVKFGFNKVHRRARRVLEAQDISKYFGSRFLFGESSFYIMHGEKVGIYGGNGCGKTTLIESILGQESLSSGDIFLSSSLRIGYLSQDAADLDSSETIAQFMGVDKVRDSSAVVTLMVNMGFTTDMLHQSINTLSMGERRKIEIARLVLQQNDILILDEPTNHLDLHSREELEETLIRYNGTILLVTHDRYMLKRVCDKMLIIDNQRICRIDGGFEAYQKGGDRRGKLGRRDHKQDRVAEEEKLLKETRLAYLLGEICKYRPGQAEYEKADLEIKELMKRKGKRVD